MKVKILYLLVLTPIYFVIFLNTSWSSSTGEKSTSSRIDTRKKTNQRIIRIGWIYSMANAPLIIAQKKGYFSEQGLKIKLISYTSGPPIKKDMLAGRLDLAYMGVPPVFKWYPDKVKTKVIAKVNYGQAAVIVHKNSNIKTLRDLRNKILAGVKIYSGMDILLRGLVLKDRARINVRNEINIITMKPEKMGAAIEQEKVDAAFCWEPFTSKSLLRGKTKIIFDMNKAYPRYPWYVIMAAKTAIDNKRPALIKIVKAHKKAIEFLHSSPTAGDDIIIKAFKLTAVKNEKGKIFSPSQILELAKKRLGWQARWTRRDTRFMQTVMNHSYNLGYIKKQVNVNDIIDINFMFEIAIN